MGVRWYAWNMILWTELSLLEMTKGGATHFDLHEYSYLLESLTFVWSVRTCTSRLVKTRNLVKGMVWRRVGVHYRSHCQPNGKMP